MINLHVARNGKDALAFLLRDGDHVDSPRPNLVLLDLNLPRRNGREVLMQIKGDPDLKRIPVVILTSSQVERDIVNSYDLRANCYVVKPEDPEHLITAVQSIKTFWLTIAKLPMECT
jgi:CheY-like chemotaxis protein